MKENFRIKQFIVLGAFFLALGLMGYIFPRQDFFSNLTAFGFAFCAYLLLIQSAQRGDFSLKKGIVVGIVVRVLLLFAIPALSDDFYRFFFDGHLVLEGYNPYKLLPKDWILIHGNEEIPFLKRLEEGMNSPAYYSVYPPLHQLFFGIAALSGQSLFWNIFVLRLILIGFEGLNFYLLYRLVKQWNLDEYKVLLYALNPLVIIELAGNLHFEGMVLTGMLATLFLLEKGKSKFALASWAAAVGIKLSPLMFGFLLLRKFQQLKELKIFFIWGAFFLFLVFGVLLLDDSYLNFWKSFRLYQSRFEFNASLYYLIRWVSGFFMDYNPIVYVGPFLNALAFLLIFGLSLFHRLKSGKDLVNAMVWVYLIYLLMQTVVHPWYIIPAFGLSVLTGNRVFLVWTGLVFLSYGAYQGGEVEEKWYSLIIQYAFVFLTIVLDWKKCVYRNSAFKTFEP
ncbi:carotene biosynthesis protein [Cecembia calidifontis]|uniref:Uncharacterized protein n=1 Tax=Cecembia calidifontis TaxID=1187080 RepID=A0A4Q7PE09_9BACT|nr:carotene biosynthesis protein [Cecembia calidifontis]RZS97062.1 hypothetical protein BC751_2659 [Cecembia calidifontis]